MPTEKNIKTPELLYEYFEQYKKDCKNNPKFENVYNVKHDRVVHVEREIPYTWFGFEIWLRKHKILARLDDYRFNKDGRYSEYAYILHAIGQEIYEDKYSGGVSGIFQQNIIARDLGLIDKQEVDQKNTGKIIFQNVSEKFKVDKNGNATEVE